ncbi:MAG: hypothetical protein ACOYOF_02590 [Verrucomicrobiaceae bacterium]|jgi:hypothetical protein
MEVFAVTVFVSLAFAVLFAALFFAEQSQRQRRSIEQDALLPLDEGSQGQRAKGEEPDHALAELQILRS